jgi:hypothetical protein
VRQQDIDQRRGEKENPKKKRNRRMLKIGLVDV